MAPLLFYCIVCRIYILSPICLKIPDSNLTLYNTARYVISYGCGTYRFHGVLFNQIFFCHFLLSQRRRTTGSSVCTSSLFNYITPLCSSFLKEFLLKTNPSCYLLIIIGIKTYMTLMFSRLYI